MDFTVDVVGRRAGDAPSYFADASKIRDQLGWQTRLGLTDMVSSAWDRDAGPTALTPPPALRVVPS